MAHRSFIILAVSLAALIFGSVGVYAYDNGKGDTIAEGVSAGGIDIGGMKIPEAREKLRREVAYDLQRPLKVKYRGRRFKLDPKDANIRTNVDEMVDEAVRRSREGNVISRSVRALTGGEVDADIPVRVFYDKRAVRALVKRVKRGVDQPARNASISFTGGGLQPIRARTGREVDSERLSEDVNAALVEPTSSRVVKPRVRVTKPKVTTRELASRYPKVITVNRASKTLTLWINLRREKTYNIAVGAAGYDTPAGEYSIQTKEVNPTWHVPNRAWAGDLAGRTIPPGPQNPLKARWMGIYNGAGIHGTADVGSLGSAASHGCVRMAIPDVIDLFDRVEVGTTVFIS